MKLKLIITSIAVFGVSGLIKTSMAQNKPNKDTLIVLSGQVNCLKPERGILAGVTVFNLNKEWGTLSNADGTFSLRMGKKDTIIFTTPQHQDYKYYLKKDSKFKDHSIEITMEPDAIWLETVTVLGNQTLEEFKMEVIQLNAPIEDEVIVVSPIVSKYAKQLATGEGELILTGPLTYLSKKVGRYQKLKNRIEGKKDQDK